MDQRRAAEISEENEAVSRATFEAVQRLNILPIPTVALVQGGCFGGGTGVISACDVVIAADNALFSITEVRWGLTAAIIIPQLCDAIGVRQVRRYALTGERFGAEDARRIGLVHEVVPLADLEAAGAKVVAQLLANGPAAMAETKALALESSFGGMSVDDAAYARLVKSIRCAGRRRRRRKGWRRLRRNARRTGSDTAHGDGSLKLSSKRVAIAGLGAIGRSLARRLADGIAGAYARLCRGSRPGQGAGLARSRRHRMSAGGTGRISRLCRSRGRMRARGPPRTDLPAHAEAGKTVMVLSAGALLPRPDSSPWRNTHGGQIIVPTGALLGLDAVTAAAEGSIHTVRMITRKPPTGLAGAPYLVANGISVEDLTRPKCVFSGTAREAAAGFPANVNVAAALSLAGIGPDRTTTEIWADPALTRNCHHHRGRRRLGAAFTLTIENIPSENPKTGRITALSVIAALRKLGAPLQVGT